MVVSKHAIKRGLERLMDIIEPTACNEELMERLLHSYVHPSKASFLDGAKYQARIDFYDDYRAVIKVEYGVHILVTIIPIK
jgi:hypothetical protein